MKKKVRIFGDLDCEECVQTRNIVENYDWSDKEDNLEIQIMIIEDEKEEWEKVMKRTGVYFVPHYEIKWENEEGEQEVHISKVRDFNSPEKGFDKLLEVLEDDYEVEIREQIKSLGMMQGILYERHLINIKNFTNLRNFINMPGSMMDTGDPNA